MDTEGGKETKRMRHESGEETKGTRMQVADHTLTTRKPTALNCYEAMQSGWQIKCEWPDADGLLQPIAPPTAEKGDTIRATVQVVINRMQVRMDDPAVFLVYRDWASGLHPTLLEHRDVHVLASTFCSCIRGLWLQREHKQLGQLVTIIREVISTEAGPDTWKRAETNIVGQLEHTLEWTTAHYMQHYDNATSDIPQVYQPLLRAEY